MFDSLLKSLKVSHQGRLAIALVDFSSSLRVAAQLEVESASLRRPRRFRTHKLTDEKRTDNYGDDHRTKPEEDFQKQASGQIIHSPPGVAACA